jgi:drug/metabolite transporter (DMT)-like permease
MLSTERTASRRTLLGVLFAFTAALSYACSQVVIRHSVEDLAPPLVGSMVALFWGTLGFMALSYRSLSEKSVYFGRGALLFAGAGFFSTLGLVGMFLALDRGEVVVVSPVLATHSLSTLVLAALFLRGVERLTPRVAIGALLVVAGVIVLSLA